MDTEKSVISILIVSVLALLAAIFCVRVVSPGERGIYVNLGTVSENALPEGLTFKAPWASIDYVSIKQKTVTGHTECFSKDLQTVKVTYSCMYAIPAEKVVELYRKYQGDPFNSLVVPRIEEALKLASSTLTAEEIVKQREQVKSVALQEVKTQLSGLVIVSDLPITNIDLTAQLESAIEAKQVAEQKAKAKLYELDAAKKDAEISIAKATGEAEAIRVTGLALEKNPAVVMMEAVKKWDGHAPSTLVLPNGSVVPTIPVTNPTPSK